MIKKLQATWVHTVDSWPLTKKWGQKWGVYTLISAIILSVILLSLLFADWDSEPSAGHYARVEKGSFHVTIVEAGDIEAVTQKSVSAPMMWGSKMQIIELVDEGIIVKKDDFIVQFDAADLEANLDLALDNLETIKADLKKLDAQQKLSLSNMQNQLKISEYSLEQSKLSLEMQQFESDISKEEARISLRQAELSMDTAGKQMASQKIIQHSARLTKLTAIRQANTRVQNLRDRISEMRLVAPADGMIVYERFRGERVKNGLDARPGQPLLSIPDLSRMQIKIYINELDRYKVRKGQKAVITLDAYPDMLLSGELSEVATLSQKIQDDKELKGFVAIVRINESDNRLRPGMSAQVSIRMETVHDVMFVPIAAVHELDGETVVYSRGSMKPIIVELGLRNDGYVVINGEIDSGQELAWFDVSEKMQFYGYSDEQLRIEALRHRLTQSFSVFEERGILHNYIESSVKDENVEDSKTEEKPAINLDKLPASVRERLKKKS